jgi:hypothetical protein
MTLRNIESSPPGLKLVFRIALAILVMVLAERAAELSHGEPGPTTESDDGNLPASENERDKPVADNVQPNYTPAAEGENTPSTERLREGTILTDVIGRFKVSSDRASFIVTETSQTFVGLENLNLARVTNAIRDDPEADWSISGLVTEYRGQNFLLIQKAIRKTGNNVVRSKHILPAEVSRPLEDEDKVKVEIEVEDGSSPSDPTAF